MGNFLRNRWQQLLGYLSIAVMVISVVLLIFPGLPLGIDFRSGTAVTYAWPVDQTPTTAQVRDALSTQGQGDATVQELGDGQYFVRFGELQDSDLLALENAFENVIGTAPNTLDRSTISSAVASETITFSIVAVVVASVLVMLYIMWAFRNVKGFYRYSLATIIALGHDILVTLGMFVIWGLVFGAEVNTPFVVAVLTIIGYSINDTIVVLDRVRENISLTSARDFKESVRISIRESLLRSLGTSATTLIVTLSLLFLGGVTLRDFLLVLATGIVAGTYSSLIIAPRILIFMEDGGMKSIGGFIRNPGRAFRRDSSATATK